MVWDGWQSSDLENKMDIKSKHVNELLLQNVVQAAPPHIVGLMGIHVMDVLAGELSAKDFAELLQDAEKYANNLVKVASGQGNEPAESSDQANDNPNGNTQVAGQAQPAANDTNQ